MKTLLLLALPLLQGAGDDPIPDSLQPEILAGELESHVRFLASDELAGRESGTEGAARAARYLARVLEAQGLEPGGDGGTFLQAVPLRQVEHTGTPRVLAVLEGGVERELTYGQDFTLSVRGIPAEHGRLSVLRVRSEEELPSASDAGAAAIWLDPEDRRDADWVTESGIGDSAALLLATSRNSSRSRWSPRSRLERDAGDEPDILTLRAELGELLESGVITHLELEFEAEVRRVTDHNVIGILPGTSEDLEVARQAIVFSAHYDHIGSLDPRAIPEDAGEDFDSICNGADDDASGVAGVLELAGALAAGERPARTLVFLLATGEEKGLLGTWHYIDRPTVPLADTVANINLEMIGRPDDAVGGAGQLWLTGYERTNLGQAFVEGGIRVAPDARPEQRFFERSDNIAFVRRGIVGQTLSSYNMHGDYHRPGDEWQTLDYDHMEAALRAALPGLELLTTGELTPAWEPGEPRLGR